jgi:PAS domain S-box-containing protein
MPDGSESAGTIIHANGEPAAPLLTHVARLCLNGRILWGSDMLQQLPQSVQRRLAGTDGPIRGLGLIWLAVVIGIAYFLAARLSLLLLTPEGVAVFWPAAGVSSGTLIALGRGARWPVAAGTVVGTIVANLMGDRTIWSATAFAFCNAGEALLIAGLIQHYFGSDFSLGRLRHVLGLLAAAIIATAVSGVGGTLAYIFLHTPTALILTTWQHWFASDALGIITVAPLVVGFGAAIRDPPPRSEVIEGGVALAVVAAMTGIVISLPPEPWKTVVPIAILFPLLLWLAARCRPVFASAGAFIASLAIVWAITFGIGHFGNPELSIGDRILAAQASILSVALCAFVLAALFAERRRHEAVLEESETRLQEALAAGSVTAFEWDVRSGRSRRSENTAHILGFDPKHTMSASAFLSQVHPDDRARFRGLVNDLRPENPSFAVTFRFMRPDGREVWLEEVSKAEFDAAGRLTRLRGLTLDITEHKRSEERQNALMAELDHRVRNVLARVAVVATSTRRGSSSVDEFVRTLDGRIQSMAAAHALLSQSRWHGVSLPDLVRNQLAPYTTDANMTISGADVMLSAAATQAVAMVLHELVTNAAKYGALSTAGGRVSVSWDHQPNENAAASLIIVWQELGGPPVAAPIRSGYGTTLIRDLIPHELGGTVDLVLAPDGVCCKIAIPLEPGPGPSLVTDPAYSQSSGARSQGAPHR